MDDFRQSADSEALQGELRELDHEVAEDKRRLNLDGSRRDEVRRELDELKRKPIEIIVNGQSKTVQAHEISFSEVASLAFGPPSAGIVVTYSVTYWHPDGKPEGSLTIGQFVKVKYGMVFSVTETSRS